MNSLSGESGGAHDCTQEQNRKTNKMEAKAQDRCALITMKNGDSP
jgi:hypothetical protein